MPRNREQISFLQRERKPLLVKGLQWTVGCSIMEKSKDQDRSKGAMEQDKQNQGGNTNMQGQLGHRDQDSDVKDADSDQSG
ncbi:MAG: hypothetical protein JO356_04465 [Acidobacteria bacterium]|nr:hypothetical protein [Acidobacteriota bacterium]